MTNFTVYGFSLIVGASVVVLLSMSLDFFVGYVNNIVVPCQHDSFWTGTTCNCGNSLGVFSGKYCDVCECKHNGLCSVSKGKGGRWGCRCPSNQKWTGTLCDKCYTEDFEESSLQCTGSCKTSAGVKYFGARCENVCVQEYDSSNTQCNEVASGGGICNACNGHGTCSDSGECLCEDGYFDSLDGEKCKLSCSDAGIDCNPERGICKPIGGILQCICLPGFYGKDCDLSCGSNIEGVPCSGHGKCEINTFGQPICNCDLHYIGESCEHSCPGDHTYPSVCSGHGECVVQGASAKCVTCQKSWSGFDCSCNPTYTCSGHGECSENSTCVCTDVSENFESHFTGVACEKCQEHWFGNQCHLRCESEKEYVGDSHSPGQKTDGTNIGCNGHGTCSLVDNQHVACLCAGTDPDWFCSKCVPNYYPLVEMTSSSVPLCSVECSPSICSNRGKCNENYDGTNDLCICDTVTVGATVFDTLDPKQYCSTCKENWYPKEMESSNKCTHYCAASGEIVETKKIQFKSSEMNYDLMGDTSAQKICSAFDENNKTYYSPDPDCRVCSNQGVCRSDGECKCSPGTTGVYCEISCGSPDNICSGHGRCIRNDLDMWFNPYTDEYRCECVPYDTYTSETRQRLIKRGFQVAPPPTPNFYGKFCEFHCPRYNENICTNRGECKTGIQVDDLGNSRMCTSDVDCDGLSGSFCAHLSSPWDSMIESGKSFFSNGQPGYYTCADSKNCIDSIYSVEWDDFCVNVLNGWYPNVLNTAQCTYSTKNCRETVEDFFMSPYDGNQTWCEAAKEALSPDKLNVCQLPANEDLFQKIKVPLCQTYTLEATCNKENECIYDQRLEHIRRTDNTCKELSVSECSGACRPNTNRTLCETKTYCRAKTCEDAIFENNIESLCINVEPGCSANVSWSDICATSAGRIRPSSSELNTVETFYSCYMYRNKGNPQLPDTDIPGGMAIPGVLKVLGEDVPVQEFRKSFLDSRIRINSQSKLNEIDFGSNNFCTEHLKTIVPTWHKSGERASVLEWLVACPHRTYSLHKTKREAYEQANKIKQDCRVHYKTSGSPGVSWNSATEETESQFVAYPWILKCPNSEDLPLKFRDYSKVSDGCVFEENIELQLWGQTKWSPHELQEHYTKGCLDGLSAPWIPKEKESPTLCDLGACGPLTLRCEVVSPESVLCVAPGPINCWSSNPCQHGGNCHQTVGMRYQASYLCEWENERAVTIESNGNIYNGTVNKHNVVSSMSDSVLVAPLKISQGEQSFIVDDFVMRNNKFIVKSTDNLTMPLPDRLVVPEVVPRCSEENFNWYAFCDGKQGESLDTGAQFGLRSSWSGDAKLLRDYQLHLRNAVYSGDSGTLVIQIDLLRSDKDAVLYIKAGNKESFYTLNSLDGISIATHQETFFGSDVSLKAHGTIILKSLLINTTEQILSFEESLQTASSTFYFSNQTNVSGYKSWYYGLNDEINVFRRSDDIIPQQDQQCSDSTCSLMMEPLRGVRWKFKHDYSKLRVHGWTKILDTPKEVANAIILNGELRPLLTTHVRNQRLYVDNQKTSCKVKPYEWWHWKIDLVFLNESHFVTQNETSDFDANTTVFEQWWQASVSINSCSYETTVSVASSAYEIKQVDKIAHSFTSFANVTKEKCRQHCHQHADCRQWSHTTDDKHCYLHSKRCHEDEQCLQGKHTLYPLHSYRAHAFEIYSKGLETSVSWTKMRSEPIMQSPFTNCPTEIDVPENWREPFSSMYTPFNPDVTEVCNALYTQWETIPGYSSLGCPTCDYKKTDLGACAKHIEYLEPKVPLNATDIPNFKSLNWTAYCHYERSFHKKGTSVPFLGGLDIDFETMCLASFDVLDTMPCPVDINWFNSCFERTADYEDFCSADCLEHIETMLEDGTTPGICTLRKEFLDISTNKNGQSTGFDADCDCSLDDSVIITDFCMMQNAYHDGNNIMIPELYNSECSTDCISTLKTTFNRSDWRTWCHDLSSNKIKGVCSKTICECDEDNYAGVSGQRCELTCPTGISNGKELACSGRNGQCFIANPSEIESDKTKQIINKEFRTTVNTTVSTWPEWLQGPSPNANGICQCALGSGIACSIPCDKCNNGTYGYDLESQYGICDSFNGICRSFPPFMRYNTKIVSNDYISYNTTVFETVNGVASWQHPERFLYENDRSVVLAALRYVLDERQPEISNQSLTLRQQSHVENILRSFRKLCWNSTLAFQTYLNNDKGFTFKSLRLQKDSTMVLKTVAIASNYNCTQIHMNSHWYLCFDGGKMSAYDKTAARTLDYAFATETTGSGLFVLESGNENVPLTGMSFAKKDNEIIYGFGGSRAWSVGKGEDLFNDVWKIQVTRSDWSPVDIVFVEWSRVEVSGSVVPPKQKYAPVVCMSSLLYVFSKNTMYKFTLPNLVESKGKWSEESSVDMDEQVVNMNYGQQRLYVYFETKKATFTPLASPQWQMGAPSDGSIVPIDELSGKYPGRQGLECVIELYGNSLQIGGNTIVNFTNSLDYLDLFVEEWLTIDVSVDAMQRFKNTLIGYYFTPKTFDDLVAKASGPEKELVLAHVERVHMHQARWSVANSFYNKVLLSNLLGLDSFSRLSMLPTTTTESFLSVFNDLPLNYFSEVPKTNPNKFSVFLERGLDNYWCLVVMGNFNGNLIDYEQEVSIGSRIMKIVVTWTLSSLRLSMNMEQTSIRYTSFVRTSTFVIAMPLESWIYADKLAFTYLNSTTPGYESLFNVFVAKESTPSYTILKNTASFLGYSASHCSVTASEACPGLLPFISLPCSGRGRCNIACRCICEVAGSVLEKNPEALKNNIWQESPWRGEGCEIKCPGYDGYNIDSICSGRGTCQRDGSCSCPQGYTGDSCQFKCPTDENGFVCSANGGCGTRVINKNTFVFSEDDNMNEVVARNNRNFIQSLTSFYRGCFDLNYIEQKASFQSDVINRYPSSMSKRMPLIIVKKLMNSCILITSCLKTLCFANIPMVNVWECVYMTIRMYQ